MGIFSWFTASGPTEAEIRAEIWKLGGRHQGEPLEGARQELARHGLDPAQEALLKACIRKLRQTRPNSPPSVTQEA